MTVFDVTQREQAAELVRMALTDRAGTGQAALRVVSSRELTTAVGRRRVVRYTVDGLDPAGPVQVVAKTFTDPRRAQLLCAHLQALAGGPFAGGRFRVPRLLGFLAEANLVVLERCLGVPLDELRGQEAIDGARDAARWLARLHTSTVRLPRAFDMEQEVVSAHEWAETVGRHDPGLRPSAHRLADTWAMFGSASRGASLAPIHKDYHPGHVLLGDLRFRDIGFRDVRASDMRSRDTVCVIDLDEARHGDPAFDLAHFCTYTELTDDGGACRDAFLTEYAVRTGWNDDGSLAAYGAYTWLKIAKQLALGSGPWRGGAQQAGWTAADAVARGLACLVP